MKIEHGRPPCLKMVCFSFPSPFGKEASFCPVWHPITSLQKTAKVEMMTSTAKPILASQTTAQNEAVETTLGRLEAQEVFIPSYQRDSDEWDDAKKSLFVESILNRLTVPAFYLAPSQDDPDKSEVVDGQQRLTTLASFFKGEFELLPDDRCPYFGDSVHYAGRTYSKLDEIWQTAFRRYNLTLVSLPPNMDLNLRLEIFRRINEGGTPLSAQDIRLSYYSESSAVRFVQLVGIYDPTRSGAERMMRNCQEEFNWPWHDRTDEAKEWKRWWNNTKTVTGQTSSEMFLWYVSSRSLPKVDSILENRNHLTTKLNLAFRNRTDEVLDIVCAQMRHEDREGSKPRFTPTAEDLQKDYFPKFRQWWYAMRNHCPSQVSVAKHRSVALLIAGLVDAFDGPNLTDSQWGWIGRFVAGTRATAQTLGVDFPESKGRWTGNRGQRRQIDAYRKVALAIKNK